ncbi:hypothetical protein [Pseudooctadecabacter jejudonensis]|uniref:Uncharacterized protein n=1 Tax=Pseudooctadecabacter jejudonensis TaxID=1391910 RepID=A0A1Y5T6R1_9RHOB|nr:hypothetical protein [Pseudooctadecabacter jejudonensis]SLN53805.1 hypothetical protein PSJ8397_02804 [Pseudooctadecabacter jejudonensis]
MPLASFAIAAYVLLSLAALCALGWMILKIGTLLGDCPAAQARAKAASVTIATGYLAIGAGGIVIGGAVAVFVAPAIAPLFAVLGFVILCLGLGFSNAISTLRAVIAPPQQVGPQAPKADPFADAPPPAV